VALGCGAVGRWRAGHAGSLPKSGAAAKAPGRALSQCPDGSATRRRASNRPARVARSLECAEALAGGRRH
jgi:hypothetical protein